MSILHITDLHIDDFEGSTEHLSKGSYQDFVDSLWTSMRNAGAVELRADAIVCSGDFVHKGRVEQFGAAGDVLRFIAESFSVDPSNVYCCVGNHDVPRNLEEAEKYAEARAEFRKFRTRFATLAVVDPQIEYHDNPGLGIRVISLDSTWGGKGKAPGTFSMAQIGKVSDLVRGAPPGPVLINTHYPVHLYDTLSSLDGEPQWAERHLCNDLEPLRRRLLTQKPPRDVMWCCGDVHKPRFAIQHAHYYVIGGRFGTPVRTADGPIPRDARLIRWAAKGGTPEVFQCTMRPEMWKQTAAVFDWQVVRQQWEVMSVMGVHPNGRAPADPPVSPAPLASPSTLPASATSTTSNAPAPPAVTPAAGSPVAPAPPGTASEKAERDLRAVRLQDIVPMEPLGQSDNLNPEEQVLQIIQAKNFQLGRFPLGDGWTALGRVRISPLMNDRETIQTAVTMMSHWLNRAVAGPFKFGMGEICLIGVDLWGAVLASQIGVRVGARSLGASLFGGSDEDAGDGFTETRAWACDVMKGMKAVVLVCDVVTTWRSLRRTYDAVVAAMKESGYTCPDKWWALSLICDVERSPIVDCGFLQQHATVCGSVRVPLMREEELPDKTVLPDFPVDSRSVFG